MPKSWDSWTPEQESLLKEIYLSKPTQELEIIFNRTKRAISAKAYYLGITGPRGVGWPRKWTKELFEYFLMPIPESGCWIWMGNVQQKTGYGKTTVTRDKNNSMTISTHRLAWEIYNGSIPIGMHVCHRCDVRLCCNPKHLFLGTPKENIQDCRVKNRFPKPKAKLTETQVTEIRESTEMQYQIADRFHVSCDLIYKIRKRMLWKHI